MSWDEIYNLLKIELKRIPSVVETQKRMLDIAFNVLGNSRIGYLGNYFKEQENE